MSDQVLFKTDTHDFANALPLMRRIIGVIACATLEATLGFDSARVRD
jgi:hypothetical protein